MDDCPTCGLPTTWSDTHNRIWCSVYGDHKRPFQGTNVMRRRWLEPVPERRKMTA